MTTPNYPILKLIPLTPSQAAVEVGLNAAEVLDNNNEWHIPPEHTRRRRPTLWLKLCSESDDIVDVDDSINNPLGPTRYAHSDGDGKYTCEMKLGRTEFANIIWNKVSRALCDIGMTKKETTSDSRDGSNSIDVTAWIKMRKAEDQHLVHLDGTMIAHGINRKFRVQDGSILSLYGATGFAYRIRIESNGAVVNKVASVASKKRGADELTTISETSESDAKRHKHPGVLQGAHSLIENSTECPLCFGIFVKTVAVHPCGHNFCEECAETHLASINCPDCADDDTNGIRTECPCCRGEIEGFTRNRLADAMIWAVALNGCFDRDDAITYLKRREDAKMDAPTEEQKECILRCGKGEQEDIMNDNGPVFMAPKPVVSSPKTVIPTLPTLSTSQARANLNNSSNEVVDLT